MVLIGEVVEVAPRPAASGRPRVWRTSIRVPITPKANHLLFVDAPEEWAVGSEVRIEIEPIHDPPVVRGDEIGAYKAWKQAAEDVVQQFREKGVL